MQSTESFLFLFVVNFELEKQSGEISDVNHSVFAYGRIYEELDFLLSQVVLLHSLSRFRHVQFSTSVLVQDLELRHHVRRTGRMKQHV